MLLLLGAALLLARNVSAAGPEVVEVRLGSDIGKAVVNSGYNVDSEQDEKNSLCFTFTNLLKPAKIHLQGSWVRSGTEESIPGVEDVEIETSTLKKGEKKRICIEPPKTIKGKIEFHGFYGVYE